MKSNIHPQYYPDAQIKCSCGNIIKTGSTKQLIEVEICSKCHPFYTGKGKLIDTSGRVDKFKKKLQHKKENIRTKKEKKQQKKIKKSNK